MAIQYTWIFPSLEVLYNQESRNNVVNVVHWRYIATEGEYSAAMYGAIGLPIPRQTFIEFENLTQEIVENWVVEIMGNEKVDEMKTSLAYEIENMKLPETGKLSPPWT